MTQLPDAVSAPSTAPPRGGVIPRNHRSPGEVQWFGHSSRMVGGQPDTLYGWWDDPGSEGPCIVKALQPELTAYASTLLQHEQRMLQRLCARGAPVPIAVPTSHAHWLATRFAGLTLQRLQHPRGIQGQAGGQVLSFAEALSVWVHVLRALQPLAERGVLVVDLYEGNIVVPLTQVTHGQLRLTDPVLIDHAHTLEAGLALTRPVWVNPRMRRIAPELRRVLAADQAALLAHFQQCGAELPGQTEVPGAQQERNRKAWAQYQAPQRLQALLDAGQIHVQAVMQFAAGIALQHLMQRAPADVQPRMRTVVERMTAQAPTQRYARLTDAADQLAALVPHLPLVGACKLKPLLPTDLVPPADRTPPQAKGLQPKRVDSGSQRRWMDYGLYMLVAVGAAAGVFWAR